VIESKIGIDATMFSSGATKTHPAPAINSKSTSVIHVFQWFTNVVFATLRSWNCANVHSSTMAGLPVPSNKLGVIHGYVVAVGGDEERDDYRGDGS
jgi:hypothetical protein